MAISRRGLMLVLSSPISRRLLAEEPGIHMSVSATTRPRRPGEVDGQDYFFEKSEDFQLMVNRDELLEHAKVFGNYYGTPRKPVEDALSDGKDVLFDIDWQGTQQLEAKMRDDLVSVFIVPPSVAELERRLKTRAQDSDEVVAQRMSKAADELSHYPEYDYIILNDDVETSVASVRAILRAERLKRERQIGLPDFMKGLREGRD